MLSSRFKSALEYLLNNVFDILTIITAGYLVVRHQIQPFGPDDMVELATWILAVLGLIAVSGLWERNRQLRRIEKLSEESRDLVWRRVSGHVQAKDFFLNETKIADQVFSGATIIYLSGFTLTRTIRDHMQIFVNRLQYGATLRVMILDPTIDVLMEQTARRSLEFASTEYWRNRILATKRAVKGIAKEAHYKGRVEIGYLPFVPSFGLVIIDPNQPQGVCFVEISHHKSVEESPLFRLKKVDDPYWFEFFVKQYDVLWASCRVEEIS